METKDTYTAPRVEWISVAVECGFAGSVINVDGNVQGGDGLGGDGDLNGGIFEN